MGEYTHKKTKRTCINIIIALVIVVSSLSIVTVDAKHKTINIQQSSDNIKLSISEKSIIITPPEFYQAAEKLKTIHNNNGVSTAIINTTTINTLYTPAEDPPFKGYASSQISRYLIKNYKYDLAKKIIKFLRDDDTHPNLEYVTLLGDGEHIPASYYIHSTMRWTKKILRMITIPDIYNNRIPTDFFYISPDYNLYPDYKVGRISVSTVTEAYRYVEKLRRWQDNVSWTWFQNVYVGGAQPNLTDEMDLYGCYAGEMIAADAINNDYFQGMNITKLFLTEGSFNRSSILNALNKGEAGFFFMMTHGFTDRWGAEENQGKNPYVLTDDILALPERTRIPIIVSVACMCGAYDTDCMHPLLVMKKGEKSFGEAVLLSDGAGISYIGTTRGTLGSPLLYLNRGEVTITKERGIAGMLLNIFKFYHENNETNIRLGDIVLEAMKKYINDNTFASNIEKDESFIVLVSLILLGDPVITLPHQQTQDKPSYQKPHLNALNPEGFTSETYPRPWYLTNSTVHISIETNSSFIVVKRINIDNNIVAEKITLTMVNNTATYTFTSTTPAQYLIRASSPDGKEGWLYCTIKNS